MDSVLIKRYEEVVEVARHIVEEAEKASEFGRGCIGESLVSDESINDLCQCLGELHVYKSDSKNERLNCSKSDIEKV